MEEAQTSPRPQPARDSRRFAILVAALLCAAAWLRLILAVVANPSPWRQLREVVDGRPVSPAFVCSGPAYSVDDVLWRTCNGNGGFRVMRIDLARGVAETVGPSRRWSLSVGNLKGFARNSDGDILALMETDRESGSEEDVEFFDPDLYEIWQADGEVVALGLPPGVDPDEGGASDRFAGAAWVGDDIEIVLQTEATPSDGDPVGNMAALQRYSKAAGWAEPEAIQPPATCDDAACSLMFAYYEAGRWQLLYALTSGAEDDPQLILAGTGGEQFPADLGPFDGDVVLDSGAGNVDAGVNAFTGQAQPRRGTQIIWSGGGFYTLDMPAEIWDSFESGAAADPTYTPDGGGLRLLYHAVGNAIRVEITQEGLAPVAGDLPILDVFEIDGRWLELEQAGDGNLYLHEHGQPGGRPLQRVAALGDNNRNWRDQLVIVPSTAGGYWIVSGRGGYLHVDESLRRIDPISPPVRLIRSLENFRLLGTNAGIDWYWRGFTLHKQAALPLMLLLFPLGAVLIAVLRPGREERLRDLTGLALAYILVMIVVAGPFIMLMRIF